MRSIFWLFIGFLLLFNQLALAEGNCPPGYYPIGAPSGQGGPQGCAPIPGQDNQQQAISNSPGPRRPAEQWEDHWGAVATYEPNGSLGTSTDMLSQDSAISAAMEDCQSKHGSTCKIQTSYSNQCVAMVVGGSFFNVNVGLTVLEATEKGLKMCGTDATDCHVYYSACSLAVRIP